MRARTPVLLAFVALLAVSTFGQKTPKPNFSGSWKMDRKKSQGIGTTSKSTRYTIRLEIEHHDPELILREVRIFEHLDKSGAVIETSESPEETTTYYTDGRGQTKPAFGKVMYHIKTKWKGDTVVVHRPEPQLQRSYTEITISMSKDGKELRVITEVWMMPVGFDQRPYTIDQFTGREVFVRNEEAKTTTSHQ